MLVLSTTAIVHARLMDTKSSSSTGGNDENTAIQQQDRRLLPRYILEVAQIVGSLTYQIGDTADRTPCPGCSANLFHVFEQGPSYWAVVTQTKHTGHCLAVFSDTSTVQDWLLENFNPQTAEYCQEDASQGEDGTTTTSCCKMRKGFERTYESTFRQELEDSLRACARQCTDPDDCVILSGYSQGGATAAVAALRLSDLQPKVVSLEPPPTVFPNCALIDSSRWYVFTNAFTQEPGLVAHESSGLVYDIVPFLPGLGAVPLGHNFLITEDTSGVAYLGLDTLGEIQGPFAANPHFLRSNDARSGVLDRIEAILLNSSVNNNLDVANSVFVRTSGISIGFPCSYDSECESRVCAANNAGYTQCVPSV
jgi:Lipase (class 3)